MSLSVSDTDFSNVLATIIRKNSDKWPWIEIDEGFAVHSSTWNQTQKKQHFTSVGTKLASKLLTKSNHMDYLKKLKSPDSSFFSKPISPDDVKQEIISLPNNKSYGLYSCPTQFLKRSWNILSPVLSNIFNISITSGVHPSKLKISKITPIFKSEDETDASNYQPISLFSNFNIVFEKLLYYRMKDFIDKNKLIHSSQYGFCKAHSPDHAILDIVDFTEQYG